MTPTVFKETLQSLGHNVGDCFYDNWYGVGVRCNKCDTMFILPYRERRFAGSYYPEIINYFDKHSRMWCKYENWTCDEFIIRDLIK